MSDESNAHVTKVGARCPHFYLVHWNLSVACSRIVNRHGMNAHFHTDAVVWANAGSAALTRKQTVHCLIHQGLPADIVFSFAGKYRSSEWIVQFILRAGCEDHEMQR